jgi:D-cysteine desulfhydrase
MSGAEIVWITPDEYRQRDELMAREAESLQTSGRTAYTIPKGASNALGALGYIRAMEELVNDITNVLGGGNRPCTIVNAVGSGATSAGLILGAKLFDVDARIAGINVSDDRAYFVQTIGDICEQAIADYHFDIDFNRQGDVEIIDGYVGESYGLSTTEELDLVCEVARTEGIFLDPVYTGKAFFGMIQELKRDPKCFGEQIIFLHTGGIFGLFPKADQFRTVL